MELLQQHVSTEQTLSLPVTSIDRELADGLRLLFEFASEQDDPDAKLGLSLIQSVLTSPLDVSQRLPRFDIEWEQKREKGIGGKRSTQEYRERAAELGLILHPYIGWKQAKDAVRAWEIARRTVEIDHVRPDWTKP